MKRPAIAVIDQGTDKTAHYVDRIRAAGADPSVLRWSEPRDPAADAQAFDGIVLCGGDDVDGSYFGQPTHPAAELVPPERDRYEIELARIAFATHVPLLAVCRGMQVLNIALGGDIHQHLPDVPGASDHSGGILHRLHVSHGTWLDRLLRDAGSPDPLVNSYHHQAVGRVATGLCVSAITDDGQIEAIEGAGLFCVGVQWHPERENTPRALGVGLFEALVVAAGASAALRRAG